MRTHLMIVWFSLLLAAPLTSLAQMDLKGARLGMTEAQIKKMFPGLDCATFETPPLHRFCGTSRPSPRHKVPVKALTTFAEAQATSWLLRFGPDGLDVVTVKLDTSSFSSVTDALTAKYGKPASITPSTVQNAMNAKFSQTEMQWHKGEEFIVADQRSGKVSEMQVMLSSKSRRARLEKEFEQAKQQRAKDL